MTYKTYRSTNIIPAEEAENITIHDKITLAHDVRHIRRKLLHLENGDMLMLDLPQTVMLKEGDLLMAESGEHFRVVAAVEPLYEARGKNALHLLELAWHLGNRHLAVEIFPDRITLLRDHVIRTMLEGLEAVVQDIEAPFQPLHGAYHGHSHGHHH